MSGVIAFPSRGATPSSMALVDSAWSALCLASAALRAHRYRVAEATRRVHREDSVDAHSELSTARALLVDTEETHRRALYRYATESGAITEG